MIDARTAALLQDVVRRESRSLAQYVSESFPWIIAEEGGALATFQKVVAEERQGAATLAQFLARQRQPVGYLGAYPMSFTTINYVSLEHLLPMLAEYEREALASLERDLDKLTDPEARALVERILETKREHLQTLQSLASSHPETISTKR